MTLTKRIKYTIKRLVSKIDSALDSRRIERAYTKLHNIEHKIFTNKGLLKDIETTYHTEGFVYHLRGKVKMLEIDRIRAQAEYKIVTQY